MTEKRWIEKPPLTPAQAESARGLTQTINVSSSIAKLLVQREIETFDQARDFFRPQLSQLHDPLLMKDMPQAVDRLCLAMERGENILVYGDYDVDGSTSVAMFYGFLKKIYEHVSFYIPDRYSEGYGVSWASIAYARDHTVGLIVTLDCGIKSVDKVAAAREHGIDFIICDHHRPGDELPAAAAVLDPKRTDCGYPYKELTGCGVGFKLLQAFCIRRNIDPEAVLEYLDLLAISIASDIVPITGENRILAYYGLQRLNANPRCGIKALLDVAALTPDLDITDIVFGISPRINAAGRIKHAREAVSLLLSENREEAQSFAAEINRHNLDRRNFDSSITDEALTMIRGEASSVRACSTVLYKQDWHKGVIGIVASRCIEHFHRPTIILTESHGKAAGSARSVPGFDVYEAIEECSEYLEQFGGHTFAAGLTLPIENIQAFRSRFEEVVRRKILPEQLTPMISIDLEIALGEITDKFFRVMKQMAPFGPGNMSPVFVSHGVHIANKPLILKEKHLKLEVFQGGSRIFTALGFGLAHYYDRLAGGGDCSITYSVEVNTFRGVSSLQLYLKDIRI